MVASFNQELKNHMATEGTQKVRGDLSITLYRTNNVWIKEGKASVYSGYNGVSPHISTSTNPPKVPSALGKVNPEGALYELLSLNWVDKIGRVRPDGHCLYRCLVLQMVAFGLLAPKDELRQIQALRTALATLLENDTAYYFDHDYYAKQRLPTDVQTEITGIMCGGDTNKCGDLTAPVVQDSGVFWFRPTYHGHLFVDSKFAILVYMTRDDKVIEVYLPSKPEEDKSVGDWLLDLTVHCYLILATDSHAWDLRVANPDGIAFRAWLLAKYQQGVLEIHRGPGPKRRKAGGKGNGKKVPGA